MVSRMQSFGLIGIDAYAVTVEIDISSGLPAFEIVGLPDTAVKESKERVRSALKNSGFSFPAKRITVNLAPADTKKSGPVYDLAMLLGFLACSGEIRGDFDGIGIIGELSLLGEIRPVKGVLPMALKARELGMRALIIPAANAPEVQYLNGIDIYPVYDVRQAVMLLQEPGVLLPLEPLEFHPEEQEDFQVDFADVKGQFIPRRAMEIAAAAPFTKAISPKSVK